MYNIAVHFDVQPERREDFIAAALEDGRNSSAGEPGTQRFELIVDEENPNRFYLNEAYDDAEAFDAHANGPHFTRFFELIEDYVEGPTWLIKGTRIEDQVTGTHGREAVQGSPIPDTTVDVAASEPTAGLRIMRADHVALRVADYDASVRFYTETLGFQLEAEWTLGDAFPELRLAYVRLGEFMIEIIGAGRPEVAPATSDISDHLRRGGYVHLCLRVENLDAALGELRRRGVGVFAEPFEVEPIGQRLALIEDNSGNLIELAEAIDA